MHLSYSPFYDILSKSMLYQKKIIFRKEFPVVSTFGHIDNKHLSDAILGMGDDEKKENLCSSLLG